MTFLVFPIFLRGSYVFSCEFAGYVHCSNMFSCMKVMLEISPGGTQEQQQKGTLIFGLCQGLFFFFVSTV